MVVVTVWPDVDVVIGSVCPRLFVVVGAITWTKVR
jgi:hypothetical protein